MRRDLTEKEFNEWKENWFKQKGCPFFVCSQALFRKVCGQSYLCGVLFDFEKYKSEKWIKECDVKLSQDDTGKLPTKICPACTGSMSLKVDAKTGKLLGKSWCPVMNQWYKSLGYDVDKSLEKYAMGWGAFLIPVIGEEAYLELINNPEEFKRYIQQQRKK